MTKIVIIGAGSGFGGRLSVDIMSREPLQGATIGLVDLHADRLKKVQGYVQRTVERYDLPTRVVASTDRRELLPGADFVITSVSVGGGAYHGHPFKAEVEIPLSTASSSPWQIRRAWGRSFASCALGRSSTGSFTIWRNCAPTRSCSATPIPWLC